MRRHRARQQVLPPSRYRKLLRSINLSKEDTKPTGKQNKEKVLKEGFNDIYFQDLFGSFRIRSGVVINFRTELQDQNISYTIYYHTCCIIFDQRILKINLFAFSGDFYCISWPSSAQLSEQIPSTPEDYEFQLKALQKGNKWTLSCGLGKF